MMYEIRMRGASLRVSGNSERIVGDPETDVAISAGA
jgi:hypothetical protein